ncbi:MAG: 4-hydroxythreonine-4-phosphate dehydrogenase PdxA [Candidimonas sp.]|nr:MAG: 4-hydroxythreonine-4-phosphate dehydrogenase PdxA [Candidimonas sp.]
MATTSSIHPPVAITLGDAAGIGPEIIVKLYHGGLPFPAVVYGDAGVLAATVRRLGFGRQIKIQAISDPGQASMRAGTIPVANRWQPLPADLPPGKLDARAGRAAYEYLCQAIDDTLAGKLRAIVTAPLNKEAMKAGGVDYPGHTEVLAERTHTQHYAMMLANRELRVVLATIHVAITAVPALITRASELTVIRLAHGACRQAGIAAPRVAVAGLNPHAGENGRFGREEIETIAPAIAQARAEGIAASGPWPGDTIFMRARRGEFDVVVAQYHDQGLIPVKYLGVDHGVNVTIGLPFVRTSVDHGTAFDIAGQGIADPGSLREAYTLALAMTAPAPRAQ